jgi:hypothetical protein
VEITVKEIPSAFERAQFGYGHFPVDIKCRGVVEGDWPYKPDVCPTDAWGGQGVWLNAGSVLACRGCGLDCT